MYVLIFSQFSDKDIKAEKGSVSQVINGRVKFEADVPTLN